MAYYNPVHAEQPQHVQYPTPIIYYAAPAITYQPAGPKNFGPHYQRQTSTGLGATQVILGCISLAAGAMAIVYEAGWNFVGVGLWAGSWYVIAGSLAIAAGKDPKNSLIVATLVFSVFDIMISIAQLSVASAGITQQLFCNHQGFSDCDYWDAAVAANSMNIAVGSLEFIFGIWMTVVSGYAIDKGSKAQPTTIPVTFAPHQPETVFIHGPPPPPSALQSEPPPYHAQPQQSPYYVQAQHPSSSNPQQMIYVGVHQPQLTSIKL